MKQVVKGYSRAAYRRAIPACFGPTNVGPYKDAFRSCRTANGCPIAGKFPQVAPISQKKPSPVELEPSVGSTIMKARRERSPRGKPRAWPAGASGGLAGEAAIGASFKIGRLFGAEVRLHWTFPVLAVVLCLRDLVSFGLSETLFTLAALGVFLVSVLLHEVGHVLAGLRAGGWSPQILLWPLGGLAELQGLPSRARPQLLVASAGPLVNLAVAAALLPPLLALDLPLLGGPGLSFAQRLLVSSFQLNLILFAFNLVPAFPLDGASILRWSLAAFSAEDDLARATLVTVKVGKVSALLMGIAGVAFWDFGYAPFLLMIALFSYLACERERRIVEIERRPGRRRGRS
jgi:Zn-dependent protease